MTTRRFGNKIKVLSSAAVVLGMLFIAITALAAAGTFFTTTDNENNAGTGTADGDMDVNLFNDNPLSPIEFNIVIPAGGLPDTTAKLVVLAYDVDEEAGQMDEIFLNGTSLGFLYGDNGVWSVTLFDVPAGLLVEGNNLVRVDIDTLNPGAGTYGLVSNLIIDDGSSPDYDETALVRSASQSGTTNYTLQYLASDASGPYEVVTSLYNEADSNIENLETFSFTHTTGTSPIPCGLPSIIAVASFLNPSQYGQEVTFTATVTSTGPCPTGTVDFYDGVAYLVSNRCIDKNRSG